MRQRGMKDESKTVEFYHPFTATILLGRRERRKFWNVLVLKMSLQREKQVLILKRATSHEGESPKQLLPLRVLTVGLIGARRIRAATTKVWKGGAKPSFYRSCRVSADAGEWSLATAWLA
jgi:hypothetical protein